MLSVIEKIINKANELDWGAYIYPGDTTISFSQYSPAGEDFEFSVSCKNADSSELPATCSREVGASGCEHPFIIAASLSYKLIPTNYA